MWFSIIYLLRAKNRDWEMKLPWYFFIPCCRSSSKPTVIIIYNKSPSAATDKIMVPSSAITQTAMHKVNRNLSDAHRHKSAFETGHICASGGLPPFVATVLYYSASRFTLHFRKRFTSQACFKTGSL